MWIHYNLYHCHLEKTEIWLSFAKRDFYASGERRSIEKQVQDKNEIYFVVDLKQETPVDGIMFSHVAPYIPNWDVYTYILYIL